MTTPPEKKRFGFLGRSTAPRGWELDGKWRINHREKLAIGCKPEKKFFKNKTP